MRAADLMEDYPSIDVTASAYEAARTIGSERRPAVVVLDGERPVAVLPSSQVMALLVPPWLQEDPSLVQVDEKAADEVARRLSGKTVGDLLPHERRELPVVAPDATMMECAAVMARLRSPLLVVAGKDKVMRGAVVASTLLEQLVARGS